MKAGQTEDTTKYFKKALHVTYLTIFIFGYVVTVGLRYFSKLFPGIEPAIIFVVLASLGGVILYFGYRKAKLYSNMFSVLSKH
jgi:uncharacterized integral membrane protein